MPSRRGRLPAWPRGGPRPTTTSTAATAPSAALRSRSEPHRLPPRRHVCGLLRRRDAAVSHVRRQQSRRAARDTAATAWGCAAYASLMKSAGVGGRGGLGSTIETSSSEPVALAEVARRARGDDVLPDGVAASAARHDVVERQPDAGRAAVDALPAVTSEERAPGDAALGSARHAHVRHEPNDVRPGERLPRPIAAAGRAPRRARPSACARARAPAGPSRR